MKLNPPASSSDLELAREIARRLHHHRRREDRPAGASATPPPAPEPTRAPLPAAEPPRRLHGPAAEVPPAAEEPRRPLPFEPPSRPLREPAQPATAAPPLAEPAVEPEPAPAYGAPESTPTEPEREAPASEPPSPPVPALTEPEPEYPAPAPVEAIPTEEPAPPSWDEDPPAETTPADAADEADDVLDALASVPPPDVEPVSPGVAGGPGELVVEVEEGAPPQPDGAAAAAFSDLSVGAAPRTDAAAAPGSDPEEELFDTPPPPSWDEIADNCMRVAGAHGAMLVDPRGQVFAARGSWPEPGPDAIAGRLVAMMDRALRDAPTRSVSAPVAGKHLTAWRIPTSGGLITAALVADAPVRAELRLVVDTEIHRGAGS